MAKHLIVLQHGLFGCSQFMKGFKDRVSALMPNSIVFTPTVNNLLYSTYGMKMCGIKMMEEIENVIENNSSLETISFIGHSFGGILSRYVIGLMNEKELFNKLRPLMYVSVATPHIGVVTDNKLIKFGLNNLTGKTGKDLKMNSSSLKEISTKDSIFVEGLKKFNKKILYGNLYNDTVTCETACLCVPEQFRTLQTIIPDRLFIIENEDKTHDFYTKDDEFSEIKKLDWKKKVMNLNEYFNSHITIIGRHTFLPFLEVGKNEGYHVIDDIINEFHDELGITGIEV